MEENNQILSALIAFPEDIFHDKYHNENILKTYNKGNETEINTLNKINLIILMSCTKLNKQFHICTKP